MLLNYGTLETDTDLSDFTGFTVRRTEDKASFILTNYVNGEEQEELILDPDIDSIEERMSKISPMTQNNLDNIPLNEYGEVDPDKLPDEPEDYIDQRTLIEPEILDSVIENTYNHPYINENDDDEFDYEDYTEKKMAEAKAEDEAFERYEKLVNFIQDNGY
ncbi:MAG: hypothetical protein E7313_07805 [Clostridiales bacterium]|nr:hypothetical protein [Clostridiales bacterium]